MTDADGSETMPARIAVSRRDMVALLGAVPMGIAALLADGVSVTTAKKSKKSDRKGKGKSTDKGKRNKKQDANGGAADVVRVAKKYKGARYVWGGESPDGFDCSGFTWYCYQKAAGMDIGRTVEEQWKRGNSVGKGAWKPGDLVFFKNTFEKGLSHNGIYIGGGKMIHAENEDTGVVISTIESGYYSDHYAGARRLV